MSGGVELKASGLFGGLASELKLDGIALIEAINETWNCERVRNVIDLKEWRRGGAETYIADGQLEFVSGTNARIVGKAFVGWGIPPLEQQERWERRRRRLADAGVLTPMLYAKYPALSIEQYIPDELPGGRVRLGVRRARELGRIARVLSDLDFTPTSLLSDLRAIGDRLVVVDLGTDLGEGVVGDRSWLDRLRKELRAPDREAFEGGFSMQHTIH